MDHQAGIRQALNQIFEVMATEGVVHGDLRLPNIMIRVKANGEPEVGGDGEYRIRVIDFDSAGRSGEVRYPLQRNEGIEWPASRDLIRPHHDKATIDSWWREFLK